LTLNKITFQCSGNKQTLFTIYIMIQDVLIMDIRRQKIEVIIIFCSIIYIFIIDDNSKSIKN
jgi:hypothetical protein